MRISDWSSDVCSSDLPRRRPRPGRAARRATSPRALSLRDRSFGGLLAARILHRAPYLLGRRRHVDVADAERRQRVDYCVDHRRTGADGAGFAGALRSEEHTSELQSLMRISYAVFCLKKKTTKITTHQK